MAIETLAQAEDEASAEGDPFDRLLDWLAEADEAMRHAMASLEYTEDAIQTGERVLAAYRSGRSTLLLSRGLAGDVARSVERAKQRREQLRRLATGAGAAERISVDDLAAAIDQSAGATRRLLERGLIPGARRTTPGVKNSPWIIPASAPADYLADQQRKE